MNERAGRHYPHLAAPLRVGSLTLKNRIAFGPHQSQFGESDGLPPDRLRPYLVARARGGPGLMIVEGGVVMANSLRQPTVLRAYPAEVVDRWRPIVREMHAEGVAVVAQLLHSGRQANTLANLDAPIWAPSPIRCFHETPKEMEQEDIEQVIEAFERCARSMGEAGFDGVELSAVHGYLINSFLSPHTNKRQDAYGGSLENRARLLYEIVARVRAALGVGRVLGVRLESRELVPGGFDLEESTEIARGLERSGAVDYISVSQGVWESAEYIRAPMFMPPAYAADWTAAIKRAVRLPVLVVGRMPHPSIPEEILAAGKADAVVVTRELIADPDYPRKALEGREDEIRRCVACNECTYHVSMGHALACIYNPEIGREGTPLVRAEQPHRVVVVGGGPAGLEAARVAALRGHQVTVFERDAELGGALRAAASVSARAELGHVISFYERVLPRLGVEVRRSTPATRETVEAAEIIVIATGASPVLPPSPLLPPVRLEPGAEMLTYLDAFARRWMEGEHALVVDGDHHALGLTVAESLVEKGVRVSYTTARENAAGFLDTPTRKIWLHKLCARGMELHTSTIVIRIGPKSAHVRRLYSGREETLPFDHIVYCVTRRAEAQLYFEFKETCRQDTGRVRRLFRVGDCVAPRTALFAVREAFNVAASL
jgi:2,4-dienoyl-CoA reductase-like NADH-dependent reductase (Old Yellow Enzyme family)/thioredoxin reductase